MGNRENTFGRQPVNRHGNFEKLREATNARLVCGVERRPIISGWRAAASMVIVATSGAADD
jgi:hypothetical protein